MCRTVIAPAAYKKVYSGASPAKFTKCWRCKAGHSKDLSRATEGVSALRSGTGNAVWGSNLTAGSAWFKSPGARVTLFSRDRRAVPATNDLGSRRSGQEAGELYAAKCYPGLNHAAGSNPALSASLLKSQTCGVKFTRCRTSAKGTRWCRSRTDGGLRPECGRIRQENSRKECCRCRSTTRS